MSYDVGEATEGLENEAELHLRHSSLSNPSVASLTSQLIPQPFGCITYITWRAAHNYYKFNLTAVAEST